MNILFYLIPKKDVAFIESTKSLRQAMEKMEHHHYSRIPILDKDGSYSGSISEGDILWYVKNNNIDINKCGCIRIQDVPHDRELTPLKIDASIDDLTKLITEQNFVPIVDDRHKFIGIVTRKAVIKELIKKIED